MLGGPAHAGLATRADCPACGHKKHCTVSSAVSDTRGACAGPLKAARVSLALRSELSVN